MLLEHQAACKIDNLDPLDLNLDSTPIITWLAAARQAGRLEQSGLRRSLIARMIWQVAHQRSPGLIDNVAYLLGRRVWGADPRATLAADMLILRRALAAVGERLAYSITPGQRGFYIRGRPLLDLQLERGIKGAIREVDPRQIAIMRQLTPAERFAQAAAMIEYVQRAGASRLRQRQPHLREEQALYQIRQGEIR